MSILKNVERGLREELRCDDNRREGQAFRNGSLIDYVQPTVRERPHKYGMSCYASTNSLTHLRARESRSARVCESMGGAVP